MRKINTSKLHDAADLLNAKYGKEGTPSREEFKKEALSYYYGEILNRGRHMEIGSKTKGDAINP